MTERRLLALDCSDIGDLESDSGLQKLLCHLEENVFRLCYGRGRNFLYVDDLSEFWTQLSNYLDGLSCPKEALNGPREELVDWILDTAIDKAYDIENAKQINALKIEAIQNESVILQEIWDHLKGTVQLRSPEFQAKIKELLSALGLQKFDHKDAGILLRAILVYAGHCLHECQIKNIDANLLNLDDLLKMDENQQVDNGMKIINLLNVIQFRELQTQINELIVGIQEITADPKTDIKLGKVGR